MNQADFPVLLTAVHRQWQEDPIGQIGARLGQMP
jgi:hypothetical protein